MFPSQYFWGCKYTDNILIINNFINNTSRISQLWHYDYFPSRSAGMQQALYFFGYSSLPALRHFRLSELSMSCPVDMHAGVFPLSANLAKAQVLYWRDDFITSIFQTKINPPGDKTCRPEKTLIILLTRLKSCLRQDNGVSAVPRIQKAEKLMAEWR